MHETRVLSASDATRLLLLLAREVRYSCQHFILLVIRDTPTHSSEHVVLVVAYYEQIVETKHSPFVG